ncbi:succinate dehydrogenase cytochrome b560 subunit, mitochondrial-like [Culicoides brevitarsis]|uniref:succinate dehydrogenase cytochrome b560 subunit, mitochondrial-like n=1 Tax=Culicoides brevitarsis TaxID=469753 RepID=UPI00307C2380
MALAFTRNLCGRNVLNTLNLAKKSVIGPQWCNSRNVTLRVVSAPAAKQESHDERNARLGRELSPHVTIYKFELPSLLSISHRFAGIALTGWAAILGYGCLLMPHDASHYISALEACQLSSASLFAMKFVLAFPLAYHTCNGIRHFCWDYGKFLTMKEVYATGYIMLASAVVTSIIMASM